MDLTSSIKKAPKWAWYTAGGVAVGAGAIHFWKNRTTADGTTPLPDPTSSPVDMGGTSYGSTTPGMIIPTSVSAAPVDYSGIDPTAGSAAGLQTTSGIIDSVGGLVSSITGIYQPVLDANGGMQSNLVGLVDSSISALANAGSAPAPASQVPTALPHTNPVAVTPKQVAPVPSSPCSGEFSHYDSGGRDCYKIVCSNGKKTKDGSPTSLAKGTWHIHKNGAKVHMSSAACM